MRFAATTAVVVLVLGLAACGRSELLVDEPLSGDAAARSDSGLDGAAPEDGFGGSDGSPGRDSPAGMDAPIVSSDASSDGLSSDVVVASCEACDGCCQGKTCILLTDETATDCGWIGTACQACPPNYTCAKGTCITEQPSCGPSNCSGCCDDANLCSTGIAADSCGFGGNACQACESCVLQPGGGGSCLTCTGENCHGCCDGTTCLLGVLTTSCGTTGEACAVCGPGELCKSQGASAGGVCQPPCAPSNCAGCCDGNVCAVGTQDIACGVGGEACTDCTTSNELCTSAATCE